LDIIGEFGVTSRNYLLTSGKCSGSFWPIRSYVYASYFGNVWSSGAQTSFTDIRHENLYFRRIIRFRFLSEFYFRSHF